MIGLLLACTMSISTPIIPHELKQEIEWKYSNEVAGFKLKSYIPMSPQIVQGIIDDFRNTRLAFGSFESTKTCKNQQLEMRMISLKQLNSNNYFYWVNKKYTVYGTFYKLSNILYFTPDSFEDPTILQHEILHYLYNDCGPTLTEEAEHRRIEVFFKWRGK
jgi:hypothetical protein